MRHRRKGRKFSRTANPRRAMIKSIASSFFLLGKIITTEAKAKELRPFVEKALTRAKNPTISNLRLLNRLFANNVIRHVVEQASVIKEKNGGYTRIIKLGKRKADAAAMAIIELIK